MFIGKDFVISFVRHAESRGNVGIPYEYAYHRNDPPLSPKGLIQAKALGESSVTDSVTRIFSSTLIRTVQTAYPTAEKLSKEIEMLTDLMEVDTEICGTDPEGLKKDYPLAKFSLSEPTPTGGRLYLGAENTEDKILRGRRCMDYFYNEASDGDHFMVVTHGTYFGFLIRAALGIDFPENFCWQVDNCCITRVIFRKDQIPKLSVANYTGHLQNIGKETD